MRRFNINEFIKFITFLLLSLFLYDLTSTGKIKLFISPKIILFVNIFQIALAVLTIYQLSKSFSTMSNRPINKVFLLFLFMILIGKGAAKAGIDATIVDNKGVKAINKVANVSGDLTEEERQLKLPLDITQDNFVSVLSDIFEHTDSYNGRIVTLSGFVHKDEGLDKNEFVIGRLFMSCCVADSQLIGPIGRLPHDSSQLSEGTWIKVQGKISSKTYSFDNQLTTTPVVVIDKFEEIPAPQDGYVYIK